jgi:hypothetical protein
MKQGKISFPSAPKILKKWWYWRHPEERSPRELNRFTYRLSSRFTLQFRRRACNLNRFAAYRT